VAAFVSHATFCVASASARASRFGLGLLLECFLSQHLVILGVDPISLTLIDDSALVQQVVPILESYNFLLLKLCIFAIRLRVLGGR